MVTTVLLAAMARAQGVEVSQYDCDQTNPMQYADYHLRFRADVSADPDRPFRAIVWDLETDTVRIASDELRARDAFRIQGWDAYNMGKDDVGTLYVLRVPHDGDLSGTFDAQVLQVFGDGRAEWVNEFTCTEQ